VSSHPAQMSDIHRSGPGSCLPNQLQEDSGSRLITPDQLRYECDVLDPLAERVHAYEDGRAGQGSARHGFGPTGLGTSAARLAARLARPADTKPGAPARLDVLWTRKRAAGSALAAHVAAVRRRLAHSPASQRPDGWVYDPEGTLATMRRDPAAWGGQYAPWMMECGEMVEHGRALLAEIRGIRGTGAGMGASGGVELVPVRVGADRVGTLIGRARFAENAGRSTKSNLSPCGTAEWAAVMEEFGLQGVAAYPNFAAGIWGGGLMPNIYDDWRQDYVVMLIYGFYLEYNVDTAYEDVKSNLKHEILALWDMPDLPPDLQARRAHVAADLAFFDSKRRDEADSHDLPTSGLGAWVYRDRDLWRDFKAADSGYFTYHLSFMPGSCGRDDMMLTGLVADWADLGPDLRYQECGQSVLALTRGSVAMSDLLDCYERTVWMFNTHWTEAAGIRAERYAACMAVLAVGPWLLGNHRHDVWRYYSLAADLCGAAQERDLYASGQLADCYAEDLTPTTPAGRSRVHVPRRDLPFSVDVDGIRHAGSVSLHAVVCDAVTSGVLPMNIVDYEFIVPWLLREGRISPASFLKHMDRTYCHHFAQVMRSGHASDFKRPFSEAIAALIMEQWWHGMYVAVGTGSLIEAQADRIAGDRAHTRS
jgi:hypothetical protein